MQGQEVDVIAVDGSDRGDGGVAAGQELLAFTEASASGDREATKRSRSRLVEASGAAEMVDAAAVGAAFEMMNRIANATGTPLDDQLVDMTAGVRETLQLKEPAD